MSAAVYNEVLKWTSIQSWPPDRMTDGWTDTTKNINFQQLRWRSVIIVEARSKPSIIKVAYFWMYDWPFAILMVNQFRICVQETYRHAVGNTMTFCLMFKNWYWKFNQLSILKIQQKASFKWPIMKQIICISQKNWVRVFMLVLNHYQALKARASACSCAALLM